MDHDEEYESERQRIIAEREALPYDDMAVCPEPHPAGYVESYRFHVAYHRGER